MHNLKYWRVLGLLIVVPPVVSAGAMMPADYVAPFIGTVDCRWHFFAPAACPFGLVKLAPDTSGFGGYAGGGNITGYNYRHPSIIGFSHIHEFQIGGILLMPSTGKLKTVPGTEDMPGSGYRSRFRKETEKARPGYYTVFLEDAGVKAELTATTRVGMHRYTFPAANQAHIIFDIGHNLGEGGLTNTLPEGKVTILNRQELEGCVVIHPPYIKMYAQRSIPIFFFARANKPCIKSGTFRDQEVFANQPALSGPGCGAYLTFETGTNEAIEVAVGISYVSSDQARKNMEMEVGQQSFDTIRTQTADVWNQALSRIKVTGGLPADRVKFYTALWHVLLGRGISSDADGTYRDFNDQIKTVPLKKGLPEYAHYNSDSLWGTYWNVNQVWALVCPDHLQGFIRCHLDIYDASGWLPDGVAVDRYTAGMPVNHTTPLIVGAYMKGIRGFDHNKAFEAMLKNHLVYENRPDGVGRENLEAYLKYGYVPVEEPGYGAPSHTLEYAYDDWCLAQMARIMGKTNEYQQFSRMAQNYTNMFDPQTGFMRPKNRDGSFLTPFDPLSGAYFMEGNASQFTWFVPQDVPGLVRLMGTNMFVEKLTHILKESSKSDFGGQGNIGGYNAIFNHGNQTDLHAAYLFNYAGCPWLTQYWVREIMERFYGATPAKGYGEGQDDDQGQLSGWFVLSSMGVFDVQGGAGTNPVYQIGSPLFDTITITLDRRFAPGKQFVIEAQNNSPINRYVQAARLNGKPLNQPWFSHAELVKGGRLVLEMGPEANKKWGQP